MAHQVMTLWGAGPGTFYPTDESKTFSASSYRATTTIGDGVFNTGNRKAVIRAIHSGSAASGAPVVNLEKHDTSGGVVIVQQFRLKGVLASSAIFGPDGFSIPSGFRLRITGAGAHVTVVYDIEGE